MNLRIVKRDIVGAFIFSGDGKLLLGKSIKGGVYPDHWVVPGGGIESDESREEALRREVLEETGIDTRNAQIEQIDGALNGQSEKTLRDTGEHVLVDMSFYNYKVQLQEEADSVSILNEDDFMDAHWFAKEELKALKLSPPTVTTLQKMGLL